MSERVNCNRNSAITYFMRECKVFLDESNVDHVLDTYTQMCNISVNTDSLAVMAANLANGGICPITGESNFSNENVKARVPMCPYFDNSTVIGTRFWSKHG